MIRYALLMIICLIISENGSAQRNTGPSKVLGFPTVMERPDNRLLSEATLINEVHKSNLDSKKPWIVFADSDQVPTYRQAAEGDVFRRLKFRDFFYVSDRVKGWIRIGKANVVKGREVEKNSYDDYGWIPLQSVLLWHDGLREERTGIHKKAFLLNKVNDIEAILKEGSKKELVKIYDSSSGETTIGDKTIYEFYFILKVANNRYLLSKDAALDPNSPRESSKSIVGWVRQNRVAEWNTRIALEPNFDEAAFLERKNNKNFQVAAYANEESAKAHSLDGVTKRNGLYWAKDPVIIPQNQLAESNPRRYRGGVVRFPMLYNAGRYYRTGVIGDITIRDAIKIDKISEINYSGILGVLQNNETTRDNYNILFVIEATLEMTNCRAAIQEAIQNIRAQLSDVQSVNFAVAAYRDISEEKEGKLFEIQPLKPGTDAAIAFLQKLEFARWHDNDDYTALYYGLYQGILGARFHKGETNIVIVIGNHGDFQADALRRSKAQKEKNKAVAIKADELGGKICELDIHLIGLQYRHSGRPAADAFIRQMRYLIQDNANCQYGQVEGLPDLIPEVKLANPEITGTEQAGEQVLKGGAIIGHLSRPEKGSVFSTRDIVQRLGNQCKKILKHTKEQWEMMSQIVDMGNPIGEVSAGSFTPAAIVSLLQKLANSKSSGWTDKDISNLAKDKYKLYAEVYVPRVIAGARHDAFSFVLFMPEKDLRDYIETLRQLANAARGTPDQQRQQLQNAFIELLKQFTGDQDMQNADTKNTTIETLRARMQGVEKEGLSLSSDLNNFSIDDLMNKRKMPDAQVQELVNRLLRNYEVLQNIYRQGRKYEFSYHTGNGLYFWIPVTYTL